MIDNTIYDKNTIAGGSKGVILAERYHILRQLGNRECFVCNCRAMPNPCRDESLRGGTGKD